MADGALRLLRMRLWIGAGQPRAEDERTRRQGRRQGGYGLLSGYWDRWSGTGGAELLQDVHEKAAGVGSLVSFAPISSETTEKRRFGTLGQRGTALSHSRSRISTG